MIKRRLEAEVKTVGRDDLKLLAKLLQENDLEVRYRCVDSLLCFH